MNDRELLELAAKAGGYEIIGWETSCGVEVAILADLSRWQPLLKNEATDCMGDALRLMTKLPFRTLYVSDMGATVSWLREDGSGHGYKCDEYRDEHGGDLDAATRRAITRAAAHVGMSMP